ncbi:MAG: low molecular weight phosphatase family protein [bacterium]
MSFTVLFLCTGNYYRSRFAEILFNACTAQESIDFRATSRGVATELGVDNKGPISLHALKRLKHLTLQDDSASRFPKQVQDADFKNANLIIALDEDEHRPMIQRRYPNWVNRIEYWHVADLWAVEPDEALSIIEKKVQELITRLKTSERRNTA